MIAAADMAEDDIFLGKFFRIQCDPVIRRLDSTFHAHLQQPFENRGNKIALFKHQVTFLSRNGSVTETAP